MSKEKIDALVDCQKALVRVGLPVNETVSWGPWIEHTLYVQKNGDKTVLVGLRSFNWGEYAVEHDYDPHFDLFRVEDLYMQIDWEKTSLTEKAMPRERATELEYLTWFRCSVDLGPAESDVIDMMNQDFMEETGKNLPEGWNFAQDGETIIDKD